MWRMFVPFSLGVVVYNIIVYTQLYFWRRGTVRFVRIREPMRNPLLFAIPLIIIGINMIGTVLQISISRGGVPKYPIDEGFISPLGIEGDQHAHPLIHSGPRQALLLVCSEALDDLIALGYPVSGL